MLERKYIVWLILVAVFAFLAALLMAKPIYIGSINVSPFLTSSAGAK
jgi:hypothetical protein